jgi:adenosylmethionine-8-amino-7-oxononanoate aminotransferase
MERGEGIYLYDENGKRYIDGTAGAGNVTLGHGQQPIVAAMADQAQRLAYCFSAFFTNRPAHQLAARVAALAPGDLSYVYFVSGGSEANEAAFKMARQYHIQQGNTQKQKIIARWRGYHGGTLGALAATGMPWLRTPFAPWLPDFPHIDSCYPYRCALAGCSGQCTLACADQLEQTILQEGPENVAAFIAEPVVMAGIAAGIPPEGYYRRIREICDRYDVLFIADEVISGFGRSGKFFAIEHWDTVPDMIVFGKGASSGYAPLGGVVLREKIRDSFANAAELFAHIFTYVDNPVAMRVGLAVLDLMEAEGILAHVKSVGDYMLEKAQQLLRHQCVGEIRGLGLMLGIELVRERQTKQPFPVEWNVAGRVVAAAFEQGLAFSGTQTGADWVQGDDLRFYPPLVISREQIDTALEIIDAALAQVASELEG